MGLISRLKRNSLGVEVIVRKKATNLTIKRMFYRHKKGTFVISGRMMRINSGCFNDKQRRMLREFISENDIEWKEFLLAQNKKLQRDNKL